MRVTLPVRVSCLAFWIQVVRTNLRMNPWVLVPIVIPNLNYSSYHRNSYFFRCRMSLGPVCGLPVLVPYIALRPYGPFGPVVRSMMGRRLRFLLLLHPVLLPRPSKPVEFQLSAIAMLALQARSACYLLQSSVPMPLSTFQVVTCQLLCPHDFTLQRMQYLTMSTS